MPADVVDQRRERAAIGWRGRVRCGVGPSHSWVERFAIRGQQPGQLVVEDASRIASASGYTSAELAGGFTLAVTRATSVYGEVGRLFSTGGDARVKSSVQGSVGLKVRW